MKSLLITALLAVPVYGATNAELEVQINELQRQLQTGRADSVATALNTLVQTDVAFAAVKAAGGKIIKAANAEGTHDDHWVGVDIPDSLGMTADEISNAKLAQKEYNEQMWAGMSDVGKAGMSYAGGGAPLGGTTK